MIADDLSSVNVRHYLTLVFGISQCSGPLVCEESMARALGGKVCCFSDRLKIYYSLGSLTAWNPLHLSNKSLDFAPAFDLGTCSCDTDTHINHTHVPVHIFVLCSLCYSEAQSERAVGVYPG